VPDERFQDSVNQITDILSNVNPVESLRSAPDFQNSDKRRLFFIQFEGIPLFWRVDIDVFALSIHRDPTYDLNNKAARGDDWSLTHSALMNAIAALKALLRQDEVLARGLLIRGYEKVGLSHPEADTQELVLKLAESIEITDSTQTELAQRIVRLNQWVFGQVEAE
jgi:hypothetical protein